MSIIETKMRLIQEINRTSSYYRQVSDVEHLARCPFCGDSSNPRKGHFYMSIVMDEISPIKYHCAKCGKGGYMTPSVLRQLGIESMDLKQLLDQLNKHSGKNDRRVDINDNHIIFPYILPDHVRYPGKLNYIKNRLGFDVTEDIIEDARIVTSLKDFLDINDIKTITTHPWMAQMLEKDYIGFLSYGNSYILFRDTTGKNTEYSWIKYPVTNASRVGNVFYSIASEVDIFTRDKITVNIAEGVFDILSIAYNLKQKRENTLNFSVTGKEYSRLIKYLVTNGIFGRNVELNIYSDNDAMFNKKSDKRKRVRTEMSDYRQDLYPYRFIMGDVYVKYNMLRKDCGYPLDEIALTTERL